MTGTMNDTRHDSITGAAASGAKMPTTLEEIRATVQARYGAAAQRVADGATVGASCCGPADGSSGCCGSTSESWDPITSDLYEAGETAGLPAEALLASLGCGNPTALADLREGEVVLDLGSGGGIDVLLSAKRVGPSGKAYGLDMTDEMLALALENKSKAGAENVEFLKGHIEAIPLPSNTVDVIISNCVINLSGDKRRVLAEAFRVLRPGGHLGVQELSLRREDPTLAARGFVDAPVRASELAHAGFLEVVLRRVEVAQAPERTAWERLTVKLGAADELVRDRATIQADVARGVLALVQLTARRP